MNTLLEWLALVPVAFATLAYYAGRGWLHTKRQRINRTECGDGPRPTWYPPQPRYADLRADQAERAGLLYCDEHDCIHPQDTHCPHCWAEWAAIVAEGMAPPEQTWHESEIRQAGMWRYGR
jgi:hypothetical protein